MKDRNGDDKGKLNDGAETEELLICPLPPPAANTAGPYAHITIHGLA